MTGDRMRRVDEAMREVLSGAITSELKDPRVGFVTVTAVETSPDLRHARVYVSVLGDRRASGAARSTACDSAHGYLQRRVARRAAAQAHADARRSSTTTRPTARCGSTSCSTARQGRRDAATTAPRRRASRCCRELRGADSFLLTTHERPDGDAVGSLAAMQQVLAALGKDAVAFMPADEFPLPYEYRFIQLDGPRRPSRRPTSASARSCSWTAATSTARRPTRSSASGALHPQHRPPPRQHALRDAQPRRPARVVHGRDGVGPDEGARRRRRRRRSPRRCTSAW